MGFVCDVVVVKDVCVYGVCDGGGGECDVCVKSEMDLGYYDVVMCGFSISV